MTVTQHRGSGYRHRPSHRSPSALMSETLERSQHPQRQRGNVSDQHQCDDTEGDQGHQTFIKFVQRRFENRLHGENVETEKGGVNVPMLKLTTMMIPK